MSCEADATAAWDRFTQDITVRHVLRRVSACKQIPPPSLPMSSCLASQWDLYNLETDSVVKNK